MAWTVQTVSKQQRARRIYSGSPEVANDWFRLAAVKPGQRVELRDDDGDLVGIKHGPPAKQKRGLLW